MSRNDDLERKLGNKFSSVFKTVTVDNGSEFQGGGVLERSCLSDDDRFKMYYCHPYSSYERGSNEIQNRMIRRFIRKGSRIVSYSDSYIKFVQDYINTYPRKLFNGFNSSDLLMREIGFLL